MRQLVPGTFADITDSTSTGAAPDITLAITSLGAVKALKATWALNLTGDQLGVCNLRAQLSYPDDASQPTTNFGPFALASGPLNVEINPMLEEATSFILRVFADFAGVVSPANSFALELITAEVGIDSKMAKRPNAQRLTGS